MDGAFWLKFVNIIVIDLVLSGDNAVIIGMACRHLSVKDRRSAVFYGTLGAVLMRIGLTGMATWMLGIPLVKAVGGALLLWIAVKLLIAKEAETVDVAYSRSKGQAIQTIILADVIMSLDNVLAVGGAAHGNIWLVLFGLGLSIPLLMWGSALVARLINRFPVLLYIGSAILTFTAVQMFIEDSYIRDALKSMRVEVGWLPAAAAMLVMALGRWARRAT